MRLLTALLVACCLVLGGGVVAIGHPDTATPLLTAGKAKLADAALVKPQLVKLGAGLSPEQPTTPPARSSTLTPVRTLLASAPPADVPPGTVTPAALVSFAGHPTRAGP